MTFWSICGKQMVGVFWCFWHFWPIQKANFGHWTSPNDFWGQLEQKENLKFWGSCFSPLFLYFLPIKKMQILVIGHPQKTFGGIWDKIIFQGFFSTFLQFTKFGHWTPPKSFGTKTFFVGQKCQKMPQNVLKTHKNTHKKVTPWISTFQVCNTI